MIGRRKIFYLLTAGKRGSSNCMTKIEPDWIRIKDSVIKKERIKPLVGDDIFDLTCRLLDKARSLAVPKAIIKKEAISSVTDGAINLSGKRKLTGNIFSSHFKSAESLCFFLVTIGPAIEDKASGLMKEEDGLSGYLLDSIGSIAVESLAEDLEASLRDIYESKGQSVSKRFSPGYCDWPIEEQVKLNKLLDFSKAGVRLNDSCMMKPMKSISGLIGIGPKDLFTLKRSQCGICGMKACAYRRP